MEQTKNKLETIDKVLEVFGIIGLLLLLFIPFYFYKDLPQIIPSHFGANGLPDEFSGIDSIFVMPVIGIILYIVLSVINFFPQSINVSVDTSAENKTIIYKLVSRVLRILKLIIILFFTYINYFTIQIALGNSKSLGAFFIIGFILAIFSVIAFMIFKLSKISKD